ncbi:MAG: helicase-exonuclease AddAB subunit AddA [Clostridia bacterium]|nr:helicase-exonuclease AddAB subunit AddA [Clostridia bacterium]
MNWTEQQQKAIDIRDRDVLVSAAAGSGKTAVLTERIRKLIMDDGVSLENMLVVTFSSAAADEMKEKIIRALKKTVEDPGERIDERQRAYLREQISLASVADISTFHKFAMGVIRSHFYLVDVEPDFGICDDAHRLIMIGRALDDLIDARYEEDTDRFTSFLRERADVRSEDKVRDLITQVYSFIMSMPEPFQWLEHNAAVLNGDDSELEELPFYREMKDAFQRKFRKVLSLTERVADLVSGLPSLETAAEKDLEALRAVAELESAGEQISALGTVTFATFRAGKEDKEAYGEIKDLVKNVRDRSKALVKEIRSEFGSVHEEEMFRRIRGTAESAGYLVELVKDFHARFRGLKSEDGVLDFNDLEHIALEILSHEEVAREYREKFKVIFIDEYQDSSLIQESLISRVSRGSNVFMVGDVKQSIYKFRLAEPEIFINKYNSFRDGTLDGERIDLNRNFRSKKYIIDAINGIFHGVMNRETCGIDYDDDAELKKGVKYEGEFDRRVSLHLIDRAVSDDIKNRVDGSDDTEMGSLSSLKDLKGIELEALVAAEEAQKRIGTVIYDVKIGSTRKVVPGDIVILLRGTKNKADIFAKALRDAGISSFVEAGDRYFETNEIEVFINLLRVIDNLKNDIPLISVLRSPFFDFTIDELIEIRLTDRKCDYSSAFVRCASGRGELAEKCRRTLDHLRDWRQDSRFMPLEDFIQLLILETGYMDYVSALPGGNVRSQNLRAVVDRAQAFASKQSGGLYGFLSYIDATKRSKVRIPQAVFADDEKNSVRIMTIHKSKGLEFPVVIVADLARKFRYDDASAGVVMHRELGLGLTYVDPERKIKARTAIQQSVERQKKREVLAEEMRVYYVALTRAMDELILIANVEDADRYLDKAGSGLMDDPESANSYLAWTVPHLDEAGIVLKRRSRTVMQEEEIKTETDRNALLDRIRSGFPDYRDEKGDISRFSDRFSFVYPYLSDVTAKAKFTVSELNRLTVTGRHTAVEAESAAASIKPRFLSGNTGISAAERGTAVHKVMQLIPFDGDYEDPEKVRDFVNGLVKRSILSEDEGRVIPFSQISAFFGSELGRRACSSPDLRREWPFTLKKSRAEIEAMAKNPESRDEIRRTLPDVTLIQGVIDCCFKEDDGFVIIDYKTDHVDRDRHDEAMDSLREKYSGQVTLYRDVVEMSTGENVKKTLLYLFDTAESLEMPVV